MRDKMQQDGINISPIRQHQTQPPKQPVNQTSINQMSIKTPATPPTDMHQSQQRLTMQSPGIDAVNQVLRNQSQSGSMTVAQKVCILKKLMKSSLCIFNLC